MTKHLRLLTLMTALVGTVTALQAAEPTSGAYVDDRTNTYVQDQVLQSIGTVNMVMCVMSSMRGEAKVNTGAYVALIDKNKCDNKGGDGESTNAGSSAAVDYIKAVVQPTRTGSEPMDVKAWMKVDNDQGRMDIFAHASVTAGASTSSPNGDFSMRYSAYPEGQTSPKMFHGKVTASGSSLDFYESGQGNNNGQLVTFSTALTMTLSGTDSGSGRVQDNSDPQNGAIEASFAYNSTHFLRQRTNGTQQCFSRSKDDADYSVWRYGVYKADGTRHNATNPGFQITYTASGTTYYGYAGYYGVFLPPLAMSAIATAGNTATISRPDNNTNYTMTITGGRLTKMTKRTTTLDNIKGMPLRVWLSGASGETKIYWDGTNFQKTETITCTDKCTSSAASGTLTASDLRGLFMYALNGGADALGGGFTVITPAAPSEFSGASVVTYRTREVVAPAAAANLSLICVSQCPGSVSDVQLDGSSNTYTYRYKTVGTGIYNWGPVLATNKVSYVFDANGMMYVADSTNSANRVDASGKDASNHTITLAGNDRWGIRSGTLVAATLTSVKCDVTSQPNTSGLYLCPHLMNNETETYEWETGNQPYNKNITLTSGGQTVTFDPPQKLMVTLSTTNSTLPLGNPKVGAKLFLDFNGFGQLYGIPGSCYNPATNVKGPCNGTNTAYAPDFSLKAGATLTDDTNVTYYVKPLDQEVRFGKKTLSDCSALSSALTTASSASLPNSNGDDPRTTIGATAPTPASTVPAVIHGVVQ